MRQDQQRLHEICNAGLAALGLDGDDRYVTRLKRELKELDAQGDWEYLLKTHDKFKAERLIFPLNEHNNLIDYVMGLAPCVDIEKPSAFVQGESPDIDIDYLKLARDYLKRDWAPKRFGQEKICEIGTYGTTGIKSAILDMARLHSLPKDEIQAITTKIKDKFADENGDTQELSWEDALKIYADFAAYCEAHPDVAHAAQMLLDRNKSGGVHAGGLVISNVNIEDFVPLEVRSVKKENPNGVICSAWTEGLNRQDLGPVGLIKFDLLVINNLLQIAIASKLVKERHGLKNLWAVPGGDDWSDTAYLNDPKALEMANRADLKCIFQFDSEGIRKLVKRGGVTCFDDLAVYSAIYRPGPLNMGMDARYCKRKKGEEPYNIHPIMRQTLAKTYGVLVFQEQVMDILRLVGLIPDMHTEKVRKAISKKKTKDFIPYKEMFVENGQRVLDVNAEYVIELWDQIEAFAEYGFNASHAYAYAYISARLLALKAHYPLEFYTAILMCEDDAEKLKDYKLDAKYHGIEVCPVHINKSKANFNIADGKIYFGFSNINHIGEGVAQRIADGQPYKSLPDFLDRFGTDATPVKALIALGVFDETKTHDRMTLLKFAEHYKKRITSRRDAQKRFEAAMIKKADELRALLLEEVTAADPDFEKMCAFTDEAEELWNVRFAGVTRDVPYKYKGEERVRQVTFVKQLIDLKKRRAKSVEENAQKEKEAAETEITMADFNPASIKMEPEDVFTDELEVNGVITYPSAERHYYGFQWTHRLETCVHYHGNTIDKFLADCESGENNGVGPVEVEIRNVKQRSSKAKPGKTPVIFYSVEIEDANGKAMFVNIWNDDYTRFQNMLKVKNLVSMRVKPPSGGFSTLTFESVERHKRKYLPAPEDDARMVLLKTPEPPKPVEPPKTDPDLDDMTFDPNAVIIPTALYSPDDVAETNGEWEGGVEEPF